MLTRAKQPYLLKTIAEKMLKIEEKVKLHIVMFKVLFCFLIFCLEEKKGNEELVIDASIPVTLGC